MRYLTRTQDMCLYRLALATLLGATVATVALIGAANAETPAEKGLAIAQEVDRRDLGFGDSKVQLKMILKNAEGQTSTRELELQTLEVQDPDEGDKSLTQFFNPRDIEGTAFLSFTKILEPDDQWLFLPALKRVKRISSANKSGPFVGSEFAYEDLTSFEVKKYEYKWLRDEACPDDPSLTCHVTERFPLYENSGYTRQVSWVDTAEYRIRRVEFFDRKESLLKTLVQSDFQQYLGQYWRPGKMHMVNHQTGKETILMYEDYQFQAGVRESDFNPNRLKRLR